MPKMDETEMNNYIYGENVVIKTDGIRWAKLSVASNGIASGVEVNYKGNTMFVHYGVGVDKDADKKARALFDNIVAALKERDEKRARVAELAKTHRAQNAAD